MPAKTIAASSLTHSRLMALARLDGKTAGSKLAELIDAACLAAGLDVKSDAVRVHPYRCNFAVDLFGGAYRVELSRIAVMSLAKSLNHVADHSGLSMTGCGMRWS